MHQTPPASAACIAPLSLLGVLAVGGSDRLAFLQGQATCDFRDRNETQAWPGAFCNAKGRVIANFLALRGDDDFRLILSRDLLEDLRAHLQRYVLRATVTLASAQDNCSLLGALWPDSSATPTESPAIHTVELASVSAFGCLPQRGRTGGGESNKVAEADLDHPHPNVHAGQSLSGTLRAASPCKTAILPFCPPVGEGDGKAGAGINSTALSLVLPSPALALRRAGGRVFIRMWGDTPRYLILSSPPDMPELIAAYPSAGCALQEQANCWRKEDILAGWPWICAATRERFIPQTLGLDQIGAVSFDKGCYIGQEIVARTHYLGAVKRGIRQISGTGSPPPTPGEEWPPVGVIVNAAPTAGGWVALAVSTDVETTF